MERGPCGWSEGRNSGDGARAEIVGMERGPKWLGKVVGGGEREAYADTILLCHYRHGSAGSGMSRVGAVIHCGGQSLKNVSVHNPRGTGDSKRS